MNRSQLRWAWPLISKGNGQSKIAARCGTYVLSNPQLVHDVAHSSNAPTPAGGACESFNDQRSLIMNTESGFESTFSTPPINHTTLLRA